MIPQSIKDRIDEYREAIFASSTPSHARKRLEDAIEAELGNIQRETNAWEKEANNCLRLLEEYSTFLRSRRL